MPATPLLLLFVGLIGLSLSNDPSEKDTASNMLSDFFSGEDEKEELEDDAPEETSPFAPEAEEPFDLDYEEPSDPSENPFASEDEEEIDTESVPYSRPDGSSPFDDASTLDISSSRNDPTSEDAPPSSDPSSANASAGSPDVESRSSATPPSHPDSSAVDENSQDSSSFADPTSLIPDEVPSPESLPDAADRPSDDTYEDSPWAGQIKSTSSSMPTSNESPRDASSTDSGPAPSDEASASPPSSEPSTQESSPQEPSAPSSDQKGAAPIPSSQEAPSQESDTQEPPSHAPSEDAPSLSNPPSPNASVPESSLLDKECLPAVSDARALADTAMSLLHNQRLDRAFKQLGRHWGSSADELNLLQQEIKRMRLQVSNKQGAPIDYRFVRTEDAADALLRFSYLERFKHHGLRWKFVFYKGEAGWNLNDLAVDDDLDALLD